MTSRFDGRPIDQGSGTATTAADLRDDQGRFARVSDLKIMGHFDAVQCAPKIELRFVAGDSGLRRIGLRQASATQGQASKKFEPYLY